MWEETTECPRTLISVTWSTCQCLLCDTDHLTVHFSAYYLMDIKYRSNLNATYSIIAFTDHRESRVQLCWFPEWAVLFCIYLNLRLEHHFIPNDEMIHWLQLHIIMLWTGDINRVNDSVTHIRNHNCSELQFDYNTHNPRRIITSGESAAIQEADPSHSDRNNITGLSLHWAD